MLDYSFNKNSLDVSCFTKAAYQFKILIIGEAGVGKTSIKIRYTDNKFDPNIQPNVGIDFKIKSIQVTPTDIVKLSIWDTAGSEKYRSIANSYLNNAQGIILCFDISDRKSFEELNNFWLNFINEYIVTGSKNKKVCLVYLVGNKIDLADKREVSFQEGNEFAMRFKGQYYETSALNGENIDNLFFDLARDLVENLESNKETFGDNMGNNSCFIKLREKSKARELEYDTGAQHSSDCC